jgi:phage terminase large subunit-like protein
VSSGWPAVRAKCLDLGVRFDDWQDGLGRAILAKRADGKYAAGVGGVVISIPRQVGKTYTVGAIVFALCILFPGLTVVWTAHRSRTAGETFRAMQGMAKRRKIAPFIDQVFTGSGDEEVRFNNGSRVLFGARERGFGRGFAEVDIEVFDEAQILTERALDDMVPATNQSKQPAGALLFFIGTPPKETDPGEAFAAKRKKAIDGKSTDTLYVELSADPDADPDDRKQWAKANPSYPLRTPLEAMLRMRENLSEESFLREALGIWVEVVENPDRVIPEAEWTASRDPQSRRAGAVKFSLDVAPDSSAASIGVAGRRKDGRMHAEVADNRRGTSWLVARTVEVVGKHENKVHLDPKGPAGAFLEPLREAGVEVVEVSLGEHQQACSGLLDDVLNDRFRHIGQDELDRAVAVAVRREVGDAWLWSRKRSEVDITPLVAVTIARWAASLGDGPSVYVEREMHVL